MSEAVKFLTESKAFGTGFGLNLGEVVAVGVVCLVECFLVAQPFFTGAGGLFGLNVGQLLTDFCSASNNFFVCHNFEILMLIKLVN